MKVLSSILLALQGINGDVYMHMPRGSNNRLNEKSTGRQNGNRLFDSQNNNNGGYNVADSGVKEATKMSEQHGEVYFQSGHKGKSYLNIEWFNQHGCGKRDTEDSNAIDCHMVIQYKCSSQLRNGMSTQTPEFTRPTNEEESSIQATLERKTKDIETNNEENAERGYHETWENYDSCYRRNRNEGLFLADQQLRGYNSIYTRQNAHGNRRGYECPEERDYFPYWHPTEWTDVAVLTSNPSNETCQYYQEQSSNRQAKGECVELNTDGSRRSHTSKANNADDCKKIENAEWIDFYDYNAIVAEIDSEDYCTRAATNTATYKDEKLVWGYPRQVGSERYEVPEKACLIMHPDIDCKEAPWSRANHLGNSDEQDDFATYRWELPHFHEEKECVLRIRYNISSDDYGEEFDSGDITPYFQYQTLQNDPVITTKDGIELQLALDTAQIARTFQDRTHTFKILQRTDYNIDDSETIENLQVRGKRGNIVQTFPAVEYDFSPQRTVMDKNSLLHIQWAGSNSNPNGNAGQGTRGTDRSNIVTMGAPNWNIPVNKLQYETIHSDKTQTKTWMIHRVEGLDSTTEEKEYCQSLEMELSSTLHAKHELIGVLEGYTVGSNETVCIKEVNEIDTEITNVEFVTLEHQEEDFWQIHRSEHRSFHQAKNYCASLGMQLPTPMTKSENDAFAQLEGGNFYLGISDEINEGTFINIYTNQTVETRFARGEPNDYTQPNSAFKNGEDFVVMITEKREWNDAPPSGVGGHHFGPHQTVCVKYLGQDSFIEEVNYKDMFDNVEWVWSSIGDDSIRASNDNLAIQMASSGYYACKTGCNESIDTKDQLQNELNNAPASFHGNLIRFGQTGQHYFMSTRNNNFSNRAQKGDIKLV